MCYNYEDEVLLKVSQCAKTWYERWSMNEIKEEGKNCYEGYTHLRIHGSIVFAASNFGIRLDYFILLYPPK